MHKLQIFLQIKIIFFAVTCSVEIHTASRKKSLALIMFFYNHFPRRTLYALRTRH